MDAHLDNLNIMRYSLVLLTKRAMMYIICDKRETTMTLDDIKSLIENGVAESRTIDYKEQLPLKTQSNKGEFVKDVVAFANTLGGKIIYGVKEERGIPIEIVGIKVENQDDFKSTLENILRDCTVPRVQGIKYQFIPLDSGDDNRYILVLDIPQSFNKPHARKKEQHLEFYLRNANGKYLMDYIELRNTFEGSFSLYDKIKGFVRKRIMEIMTEGLPINYPDPEEFDLFKYPMMVLHFIPLGAFSNTINLEPYNLRKVLEEESNKPIIQLADGTLQSSSQISVVSNSLRYNLEGLQHPFWNGRYYQFYRNGIIEKVTVEMSFSGHKGKYYIVGYNTEYYIIKSISEFLFVAERFKVPPPFVLVISLINTKGIYLKRFQDDWDNTSYKTDKEYMFLPEIFMEDYEFNLRDVLQTTINTFWNAFGYASSPCYPPEGKEKHKYCSKIYSEDE